LFIENDREEHSLAQLDVQRFDKDPVVFLQLNISLNLALML